MLDENIIDKYRGDFADIFEVVHVLVLSDKDADDRIEIMKSGDNFKPRIYKQEPVVLETPGLSGKRTEMLIWREYEMGFKRTPDMEVALKMAISVIKNKRGR